MTDNPTNEAQRIAERQKELDVLEERFGKYVVERGAFGMLSLKIGNQAFPVFWEDDEESSAEENAETRRWFKRMLCCALNELVKAEADLAQPELCASVKPLEFETFDAWTCWAETPTGDYSIRTRDDGAVILEFRDEPIRYTDGSGQDWGGWPSVDAAQVGANNHNAKRITEALDIRTVDEVQGGIIAKIQTRIDTLTPAMSPEEDAACLELEKLVRAIREGS